MKSCSEPFQKIGSDPFPRSGYEGHIIKQKKTTKDAFEEAEKALRNVMNIPIGIDLTVEDAINVYTSGPMGLSGSSGSAGASGSSGNSGRSEQIEMTNYRNNERVFITGRR